LVRFQVGPLKGPLQRCKGPFLMFAPRKAPKRQVFLMEEQEKIERRTFVGDTGTMGFDGYAGFRMGREYQLRYTREFDEVRIAALDYAATPGRILTLEAEQFDK
jgi:hypothetical protein